jgi:hypothetical protein
VVTTGFLIGAIRETIPTASTPVGDVRVEIVSGQNTGRTTQANAGGEYRFDDLTFGGFTVRLSKPGYETQEVGLTFTQSATRDFNLSPLPRTIQRTITGTLSGGDATCGDFLPKACRRIFIDTHHDGTLEARLTWTASTDLDLELWRNGTRIASSNGVGSRLEMISSAISARTSYELRVIYYSGSSITNFSLQLTHPN